MAEPRRWGGGFQVGDAVVRAGADGAEGQGDPPPPRHPADDPQRGVEASDADRRRVGAPLAVSATKRPGTFLDKACSGREKAVGKLKRKAYEARLAELQMELVKM